MFKFESKLIVTAMLIFGVTAFMSCEKEESSNSDVDLKSQFEESAKLHNEAMDYVLNSLNNKQKVESNSLFQEVEKFSAEFIQDNINSFNTFRNPTKTMVDECKKIHFFRKSGNLKSTYFHEDYLHYTIDSYDNYLTERQKELLYKINDLVNSKNSVDEVVEKLTYIKDIDCLGLSSEERSIICAATTIGIESVIYWNEHSDKWLSTVGDVISLKSPKSSKGWFDWGSVGKSDIAGAVGGAIGGALVGAAVGGVGAIPGAAAGFVGGGIGTSATDAVYQCLEHLL